MAVSVVDAIAFGLDNDIAGMNPVGMNVYGAFDSVNAASSYADFDAPLKKSLVLTRGTGSPTFTRATTAYVKDFEDVWREVPPGAARFEGARVVRNAVGTLSVGNNGGTGSYVAPTLTVTTTAAGQYPRAQTFGGTSLNVGDKVRISFTVVSVSGAIGNSTCDFVGSATTTGDTPVTWANAVAGTRYSYLRTCTIAGTFEAFIGATGGISTGAGTGVISNIQLEDVTGQTNQNPSEYVSVGVLSAPYHGAGVDGVKYFDTENGNTVASNVVTEATGAAIPDATLKGYFAEGQRQNRCLYSQDFSNAAWVSGGGGIAVTPNTAVAPDGTTTADTLTASGANGTLIQDLGVVASAAKAGGLYLKRKTGTGNIDLTLDGGATWTTVAVTSSWLLLEKTQTLADEDFGIRIVTSGDAVYAWQGQVETSNGISSPIPTTTAAVTRNLDSLTYPSAGNISETEATVYAELTSKFRDIGGGQPIRCIGGNVPIIYSGTYGSTILNVNDGANRALGAIILSATVPKKHAVTWGGSQTTGAFEGVLGSTSPAGFDGTLSIGTAIGFGENTVSLFGTYRNVKIWKTAKTEAQLQAMTA